MLTYNHGNFVGEAIQSVMDQNTNFQFCLFLIEDYSTDNTRQICIEMKEKYPEKIKLTLNKTNFGMQKNALQIHKACFESDAKYIAVLEGDDYWTDPLKLQKQVDFLDANPDFAICFHKAKIVYDDGIEPSYPDINKNTKEVTTIEDIVKGNYIHTPTVVFRNYKHTLPEWFETAFPGDWVLHVMNACNGKIRFMNEEMGVYRVHSNGVLSTKYKNYKGIKFLFTIMKVTEYLKEKKQNAWKGTHQLYYSVYFLSSGIKNEFNINRLRRSLIFLKAGYKLRSKKALLFFWLPIVFGNKTQTIWDKI